MKILVSADTSCLVSVDVLKKNNISVFPLNVIVDGEEFLDGINIELEHGSIKPKTNVTNNNLLTTAKIALAHLNEFPNYYNKEYGLRSFERFLQTKMSE